MDGHISICGWLYAGHGRFCPPFPDPIAIGQVITYERLIERGVPGMAQVIDLREQKQKNGSKILFASLRFSSEGHEYREETFSPFPLVTGDKIAIIFDPQRPDRVIIDGADKRRTKERYGRERGAFLIFFAGFLAFGLLCTLLARLTVGRERALLRWGSLAPAEICGEREYFIKGRRVVELTYRFSIPEKGDLIGTRTAVPTKDDSTNDGRALRSALVDQPTVVYDPGHPKRNRLYPLSWAKLKE